MKILQVHCNDIHFQDREPLHVSLQKELDYALFWFACRRHVGEVLLSYCCESLKVETSASTNILISQR